MSIEKDIPVHPARSDYGFTLVELLIVMVIIGILATLAMPGLNRAREQAQVARAIGDIRALQQDITEYDLEFGQLPEGLADIGRGGMTDPWGNAYQYAAIDGKGKGGARKDRFLVPINSDYDLYSMGPDGRSVGPLTAKASRDDIVRANNGGFVGRAEDF